jgi:hypothetical protein
MDKKAVDSTDKSNTIVYTIGMGRVGIHEKSQAD